MSRMTRDRAEFIATLTRSETPLERETIDELVNHALASTGREHLGTPVLFERGWFCFKGECWCSDLESGGIVHPNDQLVTKTTDESVREMEGRAVVEKTTIDVEPYTGGGGFQL